MKSVFSEHDIIHKLPKTLKLESRPCEAKSADFAPISSLSVKKSVKLSTVSNQNGIFWDLRTGQNVDQKMLAFRSVLKPFTWYTPVGINPTTSKKCGNSSVFCGGHKKIVGADFYSPFVN